MEEITVRLTLLEPLLGTASPERDVQGEFTASKAPTADMASEELDATPDADEATEVPTTVFARDAEGNPILWDYQIRGFFKDAAGMLRRVKGTRSSKLTAYRKVIDGLVFVTPRQIPIAFDGQIGFCQRPLRAQTAKGERIALARSEEIGAGATLTLTVTVLDDALLPTVREWLDYGKLRGLGQWRNSGKGRFACEVIE